MFAITIMGGGKVYVVRQFFTTTALAEQYLETNGYRKISEWWQKTAGRTVFNASIAEVVESIPS